MTSYRHNKGASFRGVSGLLLVSIAAVVIVALDILFGGRIHAVIQGSAGIIWSSVGNVTSALDQSGLLVSRRALEEENAALRAKILTLQSFETANAALADENAALRTLVNAPVKEKGGITVSILSNADASPYGTWIVAGGSSMGIQKGAWVMGPGGVIIGRVSDAGLSTSLVSAFLAPGVQTRGFIGESTEVTMAGRGGGNGTVLVPRDTPVAIGELVYYIDHHSILGVVGSIESTPAGAEKTLYVRTPLNLFGLHFVTIVPSPL